MKDDEMKSVDVNKISCKGLCGVMWSTVSRPNHSPKTDSLQGIGNGNETKHLSFWRLNT